MVRVTKIGGKVVIHENTWLKELPASEKQDMALRLGTIPCSVDEWQQMLHKAGAHSQVVEDWSGIDTLWKMRPGHQWNPNSPSDLFTTREKAMLISRIVLKYGFGSALELFRSRSKVDRYLKDGYLGYVLIMASRDYVSSAS